MPRRVEDIVPANHREIHDVTRDIHVRRVKEPLKRMPITPPPPPQRREKSRHFKWLAVTLGIFVIIAIAGYFASTLYSKAIFTIVPKVVPIVINGTKPYIAEASSEKVSKNGIIPYKLVTIRATASTTVAATNGATTNTKSTGKVTVYNNFSAQPIRLIAGTRLSGDNNLLYKLTSSIVVPGYTKSTTGTIVAGKINVSIIADQPGQNYNISKLGIVGDLKIVAYKGSVKYDSVYARLLTDIAGGFSGTKKIINPALMASTTAALKTNLTTSLLSQVKSQIPEEYIMYDSNYITTFGVPMTGDGKPGTATVSEQGTIYAILFPRKALIDALAGSSATSLFEPFSYTAPGLESLDVVINNIKDFSPDKKTSLVIHAKGNVKLIGIVPIEEIKGKLAGISLIETESVFRTYSSVIESATGELLPMWAKVPKNVSRIEINIKNE
ncbi:MAG: hypothetical protein WC666_00340 [Candidatus Paceibacterota bacterium]|jgi:hypothetical protein